MIKYFLIFLLLATPMFGAVTDIWIPQRDTATTFDNIVITGSSNLGKAIGFDITTGALEALSDLSLDGNLYVTGNAELGALQDINGVPLNIIYRAEGSGTAYTMTATYGLINMGTVDPSITIAAAGTYLLYANVQVDFSNATYAAMNTATFRIYRTNNTPGAVTGAERGTYLPVMTTTTNLGPSVLIGPIEYVTVNDTDILQVEGDLVALPDNSGASGLVRVTQVSILAIRTKP